MGAIYKASPSLYLASLGILRGKKLSSCAGERRGRFQLLFSGLIALTLRQTLADFGWNALPARFHKCWCVDASAGGSSLWCGRCKALVSGVGIEEIRLALEPATKPLHEGVCSVAAFPVALPTLGEAHHSAALRELDICVFMWA